VLRLKENTYFGQTSSGRFLLGYDGLVRLDTHVAAAVVDQVMSVVTRGRPIGEAFAGLPGEEQGSAEDLLSLLVCRGLVVPSEEHPPDTGEPAHPQVGREELVLRGDETLRAAAAAELRDCGLTVSIAPTLEEEGDAAPAAGLRVETIGGPRRSARACQIAAIEDGVMWSEVGSSGESPVRSALAALDPPVSATSIGNPSQHPGGRIPQTTLVAIAAKQIAHHLLARDGAHPAEGTLTFLDRDTLATSSHTVGVHPYDAVVEREARRDLGGYGPEVQEHPQLAGHELIERWQELSDLRFGVFADLDEKRFRQLPLKVTLARTSDPCGVLATPLAIAGVGIDQTTARERAVLQAVAAYGTIVVDPRRLVHQDGTYVCGTATAARRALARVRSGSVAAFVRAVDVTDGRERFVPARDVFPMLRARRGPQIPCGAGTGVGWREALTYGLLQHCVRLTVAGLSYRRREISPVDVEEYHSDAVVQFLAEMARAAGLEVTLADVTGPFGVPVVACRTGSGPTVYAGGCRPVDAIQEALTALLFDYQLRRDDFLRASVTVPTPTIWTNPAVPAGADPETLADVLSRDGFTPSVVRLDHDAEVHRAFPHTLRVVVSIPGSHRVNGRA
jgi:hypothetical protein